MSNLDRIRKLIALSGSANEHEARSAAFLACKLIREGGYKVVDASAAARDPWDELFARAAWTAAAAPPPRPAPARPRPDQGPRRQVPCAIRAATRTGRCAVCDEEYEE